MDIHRDPYQLWARKNWEGMKVAPVRSVLTSDSAPIRGHAELTFLVHGYNVRYTSAADGYRALWTRLTKRLPNPRGRLSSVVWFYWPSDATKSRLLSTFLYPLQIKNAKRTADELVKYLSGIPRLSGQKVRLRFIAHSLGCRVVLETLLRLRDSKVQNVKVESVLLMAAAIPEGYCTPRGSRRQPGRFGDQLSVKRERVLHSSRDRVLQVAFLPGQILAGDLPDQGAVAVGRKGGPFDRWIQADRDTQLGHGDYWSHDRAIDAIISFLTNSSGPVVMKERTVSERIMYDPWETPTHVPCARFMLGAFHLAA